uniref:N-acetyltransferase domain-containing protein n=1 Tax=viral metagenome TaxID=1070528 RepID=A0A6C0J5S7_9ZZZZ
MYIEPKYQFKGYGALLLMYLLGYKDNYKIDELYLTVDINNQNAIKLYSKNR